MSWTRVGGSNVTWVGIAYAIGSPNGPRHPWSGRPTPQQWRWRRRCSADSRRGRQEADPVIDLGQGLGGNPLGLCGPGRENRIERSRIVQVGEHPVAEGGDEVRDHLGQVLLEVPITPTGVVLYELLDAAPIEGRVDHEQVRDAGLALLVEADVALGGRHRAPDFLRGDLRGVEQVDDPTWRRGGLAHLGGRIL